MDRLRHRQHPGRNSFDHDARLYHMYCTMASFKEDTILYSVHRPYLVCFPTLSGFIETSSYLYSTIAAYIVDIIIWKNFVGPSPDPFFAEWQVSVTTQVIQCSCLSSTCILYLKSFLKSVETGFGLDYDLRSSSLELMASNLSSEVLTQSAPMPKQFKGSTKGRSESRSMRSNLRSDDSRRLR